jgi:hypothetical protein
MSKHNNHASNSPVVRPAQILKNTGSSTVEEFMELYRKLCQDTGFQIAFEPRWAQSKDTGDYRLVIISSVVPLPK